MAFFVLQQQVATGLELTPTKEMKDMDAAAYLELKTFLKFLNDHVKTNGRPRFGKRSGSLFNNQPMWMNYGDCYLLTNRIYFWLRPAASITRCLCWLLCNWIENKKLVQLEPFILKMFVWTWRHADLTRFAIVSTNNSAVSSTLIKCQWHSFPDFSSDLWPHLRLSQWRNINLSLSLLNSLKPIVAEEQFVSPGHGQRHVYLNPLWWLIVAHFESWKLFY